MLSLLQSLMKVMGLKAVLYYLLAELELTLCCAIWSNRPFFRSNYTKSEHDQGLVVLRRSNYSY